MLSLFNLFFKKFVLRW